MSEQNSPLGRVADRVERADSEGQDTSVSQVVDALGERSHYALLLAVSAAAATPLSGIPGVSVFCGLLIAVISFERLISQRKVHLPDRLSERSIRSGRVQKTLRKARPVIDWIDRHTHKRFEALFRAPLIYLPLSVCLLSGLAMPFLEVIPFSSSIVASGVLLISVAMVTRDGIFALVAAFPYVAVAVLLLTVL